MEFGTRLLFLIEKLDTPPVLLEVCPHFFSYTRLVQTQLEARLTRYLNKQHDLTLISTHDDLSIAILPEQ